MPPRPPVPPLELATYGPMLGPLPDLSSTSAGRHESPPAKGLVHKIPPRRRPPAGTGSDDDGMFPVALFEHANSVFVYGPCRPLVNLTLYALAEATNPGFHWLDIGVPGEQRLPTDPVKLGWVPEERLWLVDHPDQLRPNDLTANLALYGLIRSDEPPDSLVQISEFLRLPDLSQRILAYRPEDGRPGVLAVTNAHRAIAIYKTARISPLLGVHTRAGFSVYVGYSDEPGPGRKVFDYVFRLECEHLNEWQSGRLVCEKGISNGPLAEERAVPLPEIGLLARVFARADARA